MKRIKKHEQLKYIVHKSGKMGLNWIKVFSLSRSKIKYQYILDTNK